MKITALTPQFIREPRASAETEEEAVMVSREMGHESSHRASAVDTRVDLHQQNESERDSDENAYPRREGQKRESGRRPSRPPPQESGTGPGELTLPGSTGEDRAPGGESWERLRLASLDQRSGSLVSAIRSKLEEAPKVLKETSSANRALSDPVAEVLRRLAFQTAETARKKERAFATYARIQADSATMTELVSGFRLDRAA